MLLRRYPCRFCKAQSHYTGRSRCSRVIPRWGSDTFGTFYLRLDKSGMVPCRRGLSFFDGVFEQPVEIGGYPVNKFEVTDGYRFVYGCQDRPYGCGEDVQGVVNLDAIAFFSVVTCFTHGYFFRVYLAQCRALLNWSYSISEAISTPLSRRFMILALSLVIVYNRIACIDVIEPNLIR